MKIISDLHIHSRFSRACSKQITIPNLERFAKIKGINLLGTGDFQHPEWNKEIKENLVEDGSGILKTKSGYPFMLSSEISLMYSQGGKGRKIHVVLLAPELETVDRITEELKKRGRVDYDGRPIFGIPCPDFIELMKGVDERIEVIPAHIWTPHFSLFGANSGFDRIGDCFKDQTKHIHALETGLSSNPAMNWRLSALDKYNLVSFSDSHSHWPWRLGREATVFNLPELTYENIIRALHTREGLVETFEFFPEEGKYHYDGHRACNVCLAPTQSKKYNNICPVCGRPFTTGVMNRVEALSDRDEGFKPEGAVPYKSLIPLSEIIAMVIGIEQPFSKKVWEVFDRLIKEFGSEFSVVLDAPGDKIREISNDHIAQAIMQMRDGKIEFQPGYDGMYGIPKIGRGEQKIQKTVDVESAFFTENKKQKNLMDF